MSTSSDRRVFLSVCLSSAVVRGASMPGGGVPAGAELHGPVPDRVRGEEEPLAVAGRRVLTPSLQVARAQLHEPHRGHPRLLHRQ